jgi:hypothetical protein
MAIGRILLREPNNALEVAKQRLAAAKFFVDSNQQALCHDAINLAVFSSECALKAVLLNQTDDQNVRRNLEETYFRGDRGHDLAELLALLKKGAKIDEGNKQRQLTYPIDTVLVGDDVAILAAWHPQSRYQALKRSQRDAQRYFRAAGAIVQWAEERIHGHVS